MFKVSNNAISSLDSSISSSAITFTVTSTEGALFPTLSGGKYFYVRLGSDLNNEIVKVTARTGDVFTCAATSSGWDAGTQVALTVCKEVFDAIPRLISSNTTYTIKAAAGDYTLVSAALADLKDTVITEDALVTLEVDDGVFVESSTITDNLVSSHRIKIKGKNTYTTAITSVQSSSGSSGAWSIILNVNSTDDFDVGDFVMCTGASGGSNGAYLNGLHEVTNVDTINVRITIASKHRGAGAPSGAATANVTIIKSVISFVAANIDGFSSKGGRGFYGFENIVVAGGAAGCGFLALRDGALRIDPDSENKNVGVSGFSAGVQASKNGFLDFSYGFISGCAANAVSATYRGAVEFYTGYASGCASDGISASFGGYINAASMTSTGHGGTYAIYANVFSSINAVSHSSASPATLSPSANTIANENSYINT